MNNGVGFNPHNEIHDNLPYIDSNKIKDYYLKKTKNNSGGFTWELEKKRGALSKISSFLGSTFQKGQYVSSEDLEGLMKAAAGRGNRNYEPGKVIGNKKILADRDIMSLIDNDDFQTFARLSTEIKQTPKQKFLRAADSAKIIGKGLNKMDEQGVKGKMLSEGYWLEAVTKEKYYGGDLHGFFNIWEKSDSPLNFQDWLQKENPSGLTYETWEQENPQDIRSLGHVTYLQTPEERGPYHVTFEGGIAKRNGTVFDTGQETSTVSGQGTAIFVVDSTGKLYSGSHRRGEFHHSSFLGGGAVIGAGEIRTNSLGQVTTITDKSGHYKPNKEQMLNTLTVLRDNGVDLSHVNLLIGIGEKQTIYNAQEYLMTQGECNPSGIGIFKFQRDGDNNISGFVLDNEGAKTGKREIIPNLKASIDSLNIPEGTPLTLTRDFGTVGVTYDAAEYVQQQGSLQPKSWTGGTFEFSEGKIVGVTVTEGRPVDSEEMIQFLSHLNLSRIDLAQTTLRDESGAQHNARDYLMMLASSRRG